MTRLLMLVLAAVLVVPSTRGETVEPTAVAWQALPSGLDHCIINGAEGGWPIGVELVRVPASGFRMRVVAQPGALVHARELAGDARVLAAATASGPAADDPDCPHGWLVVDGKEISRLSLSYGGVFRVEPDGSFELDRSRLLTVEPKVVFAAQSRTWLVVEGMAYPDVDVVLDWYGFLALDTQHRLVLGRSTLPVLPADLGAFLARSEAEGGAGLVAAVATGRGPQVQWLLRGSGPGGADDLDAAAMPRPSLLVIER